MWLKKAVVHFELVTNTNRRALTLPAPTWRTAIAWNPKIASYDKLGGLLFYSIPTKHIISAALAFDCHDVAEDCKAALSIKCNSGKTPQLFSLTYFSPLLTGTCTCFSTSKVTFCQNIFKNCSNTAQSLITRLALTLML